MIIRRWSWTIDVGRWTMDDGQDHKIKIKRLTMDNRTWTMDEKAEQKANSNEIAISKSRFLMTQRPNKKQIRISNIEILNKF